VRSLAEQGLNRETIRLNREIILPVKARNREITGQDRLKQDWASFRPNPATRNVAPKPADTSQPQRLFEVVPRPIGVEAFEAQH
jgi:hypothetical protein